MYNFRARARAVPPGSIQAQGMGARVSPTAASQVTSSSQALEILEREVNTVLETEMSVSNDEINVENTMLSAENASQNTEIEIHRKS